MLTHTFLLEKIVGKNENNYDGNSNSLVEYEINKISVMDEILHSIGLSNFRA